MRFLFVCGEYYPKPSANGVCTLRIQEELIKRGIASDVIYTGDKQALSITDFGYGYCIKNETPNKKILSKYQKKLELLFRWPIKNYQIIDEYKKIITYMNNHNSYDLIISVLRPIEGALACIGLNGIIVYELDSITNNGENLYGIKHLLSYRAKKIERRIYDNAFKVFHLKCHESYYGNSYYDNIRAKFKFTDIPSLVRNNVVHNSNKSDSIHMLYAGALIKNCNAPDYAIELIEECAKVVHIQCDFYSRGDCEQDIIRAQSQQKDTIRSMGYVTKNEIQHAEENADAFLSIGYHYSGTVTSIPSKIFEYMSTGKPIVHIFGGKNDTAIGYLAHYDNGLIVYPNNSLKDNAKQMSDFLKRTKGKYEDVERLRNDLSMNTPEWTVNMFISCAKEYAKGRRQDGD